MRLFLSLRRGTPCAVSIVIRRLLVSAVLITATTGCQGPGTFQFDIAGDMRLYTPPEHPGSSYFQGAVEAMRDLGPSDFIICPGDIDPPDRVRATLDAVLGSDFIWYPVVGNHELDKPESLPYLRAVNAGGRKLPHIVREGPPGAVETCYAFDYRGAHFVVLNQYYDGQRDDVEGGDVSDALYQWLEKDLDDNRLPITFVVGHEPSVAAPDMDTGRVRHRGDSLDAHEKRNHRFWSLLRKHKVTAYICGHSHNLSILRLNGVWQLDSGHARGLGDKGAPSSFMRVRVQPNAVIVDVYRAVDEKRQTYQRTWSEQIYR